MKALVYGFLSVFYWITFLEEPEKPLLYELHENEVCCISFLI